MRLLRVAHSESERCTQPSFISLVARLDEDASVAPARRVEPSHQRRHQRDPAQPRKARTLSHALLRLFSASSQVTSEPTGPGSPNLLQKSWTKVLKGTSVTDPLIPLHFPFPPVPTLPPLILFCDSHPHPHPHPHQVDHRSLDQRAVLSLWWLVFCRSSRRVMSRS